MTFDRRIQLFVVLAATFVTCLLVGDIIGGKLLQLDGAGRFVISVGMLPFPVTFVLTDLLNEFYGKRAARFITWVGFGMALLAFGLIDVAGVLPWAPFTSASDWTGVRPEAFDNVFGGSKRILFASMVAYLSAQFTDIAIFNALKRATKNRMLWLRATGSTVASQFLDTIIVQVIAWYGVLAFDQIVLLMLTSYAVKLVVAVGLTPLIYAGHAVVERWIGIQPVTIDDAGEELETAQVSSPPR